MNHAIALTSRNNEYYVAVISKESSDIIKVTLDKEEGYKSELVNNSIPGKILTSVLNSDMVLFKTMNSKLGYLKSLEAQDYKFIDLGFKLTFAIPLVPCN